MNTHAPRIARGEGLRGRSDGRAWRAGGGRGGTRRAGAAEPLGGTPRGGPGAGGAVVAGGRDQYRDRDAAGRAGRAGATLAVRVPARRGGGATVAPAAGPDAAQAGGGARRGAGRARGAARRPAGLDPGPARGRGRGAHRRDDLRRSPERGAAKGGYRWRPAAAHAQGPAGRAGGRLRGPAPQAPEAASAGWRHPPAVRGRVGGADPPLSRPLLGPARRRPPGRGARAGEEARAPRRARPRQRRADRPHQRHQAVRRLRRPAGAARPGLRPGAGPRGSAGLPGPGQRPDPYEQGEPEGARRAPLAHGRVAAEVRAGAERHRALLARPEAPLPGPPHLPRRRPARSRHPRSCSRPQPRASCRAVRVHLQSCLVVAAILLAALPESPRYLARHPQRSRELAAILRRMGRDAPDGARFVDSRERQDVPRASVSTLFTPDYRRDTVGLWIAFFCCILGIYIVFSWMPSLLASAGFDLAWASTGLAVFNIGGVIGALAGAWLMTHLGSRPTMLTTAALGVVGALVLMALPFRPADTTRLMVLLFLEGGFNNAVQTNLYALSAQVYPTQVRATGVGATAGVGRSGAIVRSFLGALALASGIASYFGMVAATMALTFVGLAIVRRHTPPVAAHTAAVAAAH